MNMIIIIQNHNLFHMRSASHYHKINTGRIIRTPDLKGFCFMHLIRIKRTLNVQIERKRRKHKGIREKISEHIYVGKQMLWSSTVIIQNI